MKFIKDGDCVIEYQKLLQDNKPEFELEDSKNSINRNWKKIEKWLNQALLGSCGYQQQKGWNQNLWWPPELRNQSQEIDDYLNNRDQNQTDREIFKRYRENWKRRKEG